MKKKKFALIEKELKEKRATLLNKLMKDREKYVNTLKDESGDLADKASETIERELIYDLSITEKEELEEINSALKKIEEGTYGKCEMCGIDIPIERLEIKPYARYCVKCQEKVDRKKTMRL